MLVFAFILLWITVDSSFTDLICITGGDDGYGNTMSTTECVNSTTGQWALRPDLNFPQPSKFMSSINLGTVACLAGGDIAIGADKRVVCLNGSSAGGSGGGGSSAWVYMPPLAGARNQALTFYGPGWVGLVGGGGEATWESSLIPINMNFSSSFSFSSSSPFNLSWSLNPSIGLSMLLNSVTISINGTPCTAGGYLMPQQTLTGATNCLFGNLSVINALHWGSGPDFNARESHTPLRLPGIWCLVGGQNMYGGPFLSNVDCLNEITGERVSNEEWSLPGPSSNGVNFTFQGMPCIAGGQTNQVWCANISSSSSLLNRYTSPLSTVHIQWLTMPNLTTPRCRHSSFNISIPIPALSPTEQLTPRPPPQQPEWMCVSGGLTSAITSTSATECFNETSKAWQLIPSLYIPTTTYDMSPINFGSIACLGGGANSGIMQQFICTNGSALFGGSGGGSGAGWVPFSNLPLARTGAATLYGSGWVGLAEGVESTWLTASRTGLSAIDVHAAAAQLQWSIRSSQSTITAQYSAVAVFNGSICVFGGQDSSTTNALSTSQCLTPDYNSLRSITPPTKIATPVNWTAGPNLTIGKFSHTSMIIYGRSCFVGGQYKLYGNSFSRNTVECLDLNGSTAEPSYSVPNTVSAAPNVTIAGMPCITGGTPTGYFSSIFYNTVWCANRTGDSYDTAQGVNKPLIQWIAGPALSTVRAGHASFIITAILPPTPGPTAAPTAAPSFSPSFSPTLSPTFSPTPIILVPATKLNSSEWTLDYPLVFSTSTWVTFSILEPIPPTAKIQWTFLSLPSSQPTFDNTAQVQIPPYSFIPGSGQTFSLSLTNIPNSFTQSYSFTVISSFLSVEVDGGNREVPINSIIQLTAILSSQSPSDIRMGEYGYMWELLSPPCGNLTILTDPSEATISVRTSSEITTCTLSITVQEAGSGSSGIPGKATVTLDIKPNLAFTVGISGDFQSPISTTSPLRLLGTVYPMTATTLSPSSSSNNNNNYSYSWNINPPIIIISQSCRTMMKMNTRALVIDPFCLSEDTNYTITFNVSGAGASSNTATASAWISFTTNTRPFGGNCTVTPTSGMALITPFTITCGSWSQVASTSLTYTLKRIGGGGGGELIILSGPQSRSEFDGIYLNILNSTLEQESVTLIVYISSSDSGEFSSLTIPTVIISLPSHPKCPNISTDKESVQHLTVLVSELQNDPSMQACTPTERQALWDALWGRVQQLSQQFYLTSTTVEMISTALEALMEVAPPLGGSQAVTIPSNFQQSLTAVLLALLKSPDATINSTNALINVVELSLPALAQGANVAGGCDALNQVVNALAIQIQKFTSPTLPGEDAVVLSSSGNGGSELSIVSATYFGDSSAQLNSLLLTLPSSLLSQGGDVSQITVTDYENSLSQCRAPSGSSKIVGPIVDITLSGQVGVIPVTTVAGGFSFQLPFTQDASCGLLHCVWWDSRTNQWRADGCTGSQNSDKSMTCTCTHLTEFSLLLDPGCVSTAYKIAYLALMGAYGLLALIVVIKLVHRLTAHCSSSNRGGGGGGGVRQVLTSLVLQHSMIFVLACLRILDCAILSSTDRIRDLDLAARSAILVMPYIVMFWIYTLMVFQWAALYHFGMQTKGDAFSKVRIVFAGSNLAVSGAVIAGLLAVSTKLTPETTQRIVEVAPIVIATVTAITAIAFLVYARVIYLTLGLANTSTEKERCCAWSVRRKILVGGIIVSAMLCLESILHIVTAISLVSSKSNLGQGDISEIITLGAELTCVSTVVIMYHRAMMTEGRKPTKGKRINPHSGVMMTTLDKSR